MAARRKRQIWKGTVSIRQRDGTIVKVAEVEDVTKVLGEQKITWFMPEEERAEHNRRMMERVADVVADMKDENGNPLLPDGTYNIMDLLRK